jgi:integrase/recombinase XerD
MMQYPLVGKAFYMIGDPIDGVITDKSGIIYRPFQLFIQHMLDRGYASNSVNAYADHVYRFLNYVARAIEITPPPIDKPKLRLIILSYTSYLLHGEDAPDPVVQQIANEQGKKNKTSLNSLAPIDHAISYFIRFGELEQLEECQDNITPLFSAAKNLISSFETKEIKKNSMLAGVIKGGLTHKERLSYGVLVRKKSKKKNRVYITQSIDFSSVNGLFESASNLRDKTLYAFLAASGARSHEALQLRLTDVNVAEKEVYLRSPEELDRNILGLSPEEEELLAWKGRNTETTFLIEPFKSKFFYYLRQYLKQDRVSTCGHPFIFQNYKTIRPFFCSDRSSRIKQFKAAAKKSGIMDTTCISPHSLRHTYGTYALNYLPLPHGEFGLPIQYVRILMGHESLSSTEVYAKEDEDILKEQIQYANELLFDANEVDLKMISLKYQESKLTQIKNEIANLLNKERLND